MDKQNSHPDRRTVSEAFDDRVQALKAHLKNNPKDNSALYGLRKIIGKMRAHARWIKSLAK